MNSLAGDKLAFGDNLSHNASRLFDYQWSPFRFLATNSSSAGQVRKKAAQVRTLCAEIKLERAPPF
ncbi:hypothetical protein QV04_06095 [Gallibacterium genomosp. 1]|nr:hypothetical protein QV04_06095 [Gallibacterium genomosp. 1]